MPAFVARRAQRDVRSQAIVCAATLALASLAATSDTRAQPRIRVRSASSVTAQISVATQTGVAARSLVQVGVRGTLRDDLGMGLPGAEVEVVVAPVAAAAAARTARTDTAGHFEVTMSVAPGAARLAVSFHGDALHAGTTYVRNVDLGKADVTLQLVGPRQLVVTAAAPRFELAAFSDEGSASLPIVIADEASREIVRGTTDVSGRWTFSVPIAAIGRPGVRTLRASFAGDARRNDVSTTHRVLVRSPSFLSLRADRSSLSSGDSVTLDGQLLDHEGPIRGAAVGVFAGARHLGTATTDRTGDFSLEFPIDDDDRGTLLVAAHFAPDVPWREVGRSPDVPLRVIASQPAPLGWIAAIIVGTVLLLGAAQLARRPGERTTSAPRAIPPPRPGIALGRPASRARAAQTRIAGRVSDVDDPSGAPIENARVRVTRGDEIVVEVATDEAGEFEIDELPAGRCTVSIEAHGYESQLANATVPHRGEWSGMRVRLESRRRRIERVFRAVVVPDVVSAERYATSTVREVARDAANRRGVKIDDLVEIAETAAYGAEPPSASSVAKARDAAERASTGSPRRSR